MSTGTLNTAVEFDPLYFGLRQKEGRIYTDEEVATLPFIYTSHPYYHEWVMRKHSQKHCSATSIVKNIQQYPGSGLW